MGLYDSAVANSLLEPLSPEQRHLIQVMFEPFDQSGDWPVWQYVDLTLDARHGFDAADVLSSLPEVGERNPMSMAYGLIWRPDSYRPPNPDDTIALTAAGLWHLAAAEPVLTAFLATVRFLVQRQRQLVPSPLKVVEASVTSGELAEHVLGLSTWSDSSPPVEMVKLNRMLRHEPFLYNIQHHTSPGSWTVRVPAILREYRDVVTIDDYIAQVAGLVGKPRPPSVPMSVGPLDIPYAVGFLDAVWENRAGSHLFVNLDPASVARLTQPCGDEEDFNSLMSALADVLGQAVVPGRKAPPQGGALEAVRDYLIPMLGEDESERVREAFETLIHIRRIRVNAQHADKRHRAVTTFKAVGLPFPPANWPQTWAHIAALAKGALDILREEVHAGVSMDRRNGA